MPEQQVVESSEILLEDIPEEDLDDTSGLARTLANTRVVSQDDTYQVESVERTEVKSINSFYYLRSDGSVRRIKEITEADNLSTQDASADEFTLEDISIGQLTPEHLNSYPRGEAHRDVTPIEPITYLPPTKANRTLYFAEIQTEYVVTIQLRNEVGERQTVYKTFDLEEPATKFIDKIGDSVELTLHGDTIHIENTPNSPSEETETSESTLRSKIDTAHPILLGFTVWFVPALVLFGVNQVGSLILGIFGIGLWLLALYIALEKSALGGGETSEKANKRWHSTTGHNQFSDGTTTTTTTTTNTDSEMSEQIELNIAYDLDSDTETYEPVTEVTVKSEFNSDTLALTINGLDDSPIWEYEATTSGVFKESGIVDFYTELGFDKSERSTFTAFASTKEYEGIPRLSSKDVRDSLYLYPEDPREIDNPS